MKEDIDKSIVYGIYIAEDDTIGITIFDDGTPATTYLSKEFALLLARDIMNHALKLL